jgi:alkyl sulfatase BDS1-like metallo-beta-lactamase superfamily hydrolase
VLNTFPSRHDANPTATLRISSLDFKLLMLRVRDAGDLMGDGRLVIEGDALAFADLGSLFDQFSPRWPIVTPRPAWD